MKNWPNRVGVDGCASGKSGSVPAWLCAVLALLVSAPSVRAAEPPAAEVSFHDAEAPGDLRYGYYTTLLRLALDRTRAEYGDYAWVRREGMSHRRQIESLADGRLTVLLQPDDAALTARFIKVDVPLDRGAYGYRVFLVRREDLPRFARVRTVEDLRAFSVGLGAGWLDESLWRQNGFRVETAATYEGLFTMLDAGRYDMLSRGAPQAESELADRSAAMPGLVVEPTLCVYYPWPRYFYCQDSTEGRRLAARLDVGLRAVMADAAVFEPLYERHLGAPMRRLNLGSRRVLSLQPASGAPAPVPPATAAR